MPVVTDDPDEDAARPDSITTITDDYDDDDVMQPPG